MRAVIQRVHHAEITIDHQEKRQIKEGLVVFLGVLKGDTENQSAFLADKICNLRIFEDENEKMNFSLKDINGDILIVSNFTLATDCEHGRRPSFDLSAPFAEAKALYEHFVEVVRAQNIVNVQTGEFAAHMDVDVSNNGPVTIIIDTEKIGK
ncbi:D-aminoacyl-tRNA deacylase [Scatolibacter rhodanostii]|uniref:D-aminoacyl-tRNA deacylase n=1 Tax=Scatolibacter rhodanostii TaxID=2014781 RepID=UPI000C06FA44|nr:D-aminoacyl-tRNA deacylase [Scatolibacter rhodanostii]